MLLWLLGRGECDSVRVWRPLLGPVQSLEPPALYANTDQRLAGTVLEKETERRPHSQVSLDCD